MIRVVLGCTLCIFLSGPIWAELIVQPAPLTTSNQSSSSNSESSGTFSTNSSSSSSSSQGQALATSASGDFSVLGLWYVNTGSASDDDLLVLRMMFHEMLYGTKGEITVSDLEIISTANPDIVGRPLVYPNPVKWSKKDAKIGYVLTQPMDITLQIYNMRGHRIFEKTFESSTRGGLKGVNQLRIGTEITFNGYDLSSGVYFFFLLYEGKMIGKGKMAVVP